MKIKLSSHFTYAKLIRFTLPSIVMMLITMVYGVVDGLFISNVAGDTAFAAMNLIFPFVMSFGAVGFMLGTGGCALVAKSLGEGDSLKANQIFSLIVYVLIAVGAVFAVVSIAYLKPVAILLGADEVLLPYCISYGGIMLAFTPAFMLQTAFQSFLSAAEKPKLGMLLAIVSGITNIAFDYIFISRMGWGLSGAAAATGISQAVGSVIPLCYFAAKNSSALRLVPFKWNGVALRKSALNGFSELLTNLSISLVNMLYNFQLMRLAGAQGVSAFGVIMYAFTVFSSVFMGYSIGTAPLISFNYGSGNRDEQKSIFGKSHVIILSLSVMMTVFSFAMSKPLASLFVGYDEMLFNLTAHALRVFSVCFLFCGVNMFASSFFTALNNGTVSALLSLLRTLILQIAAIFLLPLLCGVDGIWLAMTAAEATSLIFVLWAYNKNRKRYGYS